MGTSPKVTLKLINNQAEGKVAFKIKQSKSSKTRYRINPTVGIIRDTQEVQGDQFVNSFQFRIVSSLRKILPHTSIFI